MSSPKGRHQKKTQVFFGVSPKGGEGGLAESKISLAEKTEIFLDFFWQQGGKGGVNFPNDLIFFPICAKNFPNDTISFLIFLMNFPNFPNVPNELS